MDPVFAGSDSNFTALDVLPPFPPTPPYSPPSAYELFEEAQKALWLQADATHAIRPITQMWIGVSVLVAIPTIFVLPKHYLRVSASKDDPTRRRTLRLSGEAVRAARYGFLPCCSMMLCSIYQTTFEVGMVGLGLEVAFLFTILTWKFTQKLCSRTIQQAQARHESRDRSRSVDAMIEKLDSIKWQYDATNVYQDLTAEPVRVVSIAAAQCMLVGFYVAALVLAGQPDFTSIQTFVFYYASTLLQVVISDRYGERVLSSNAKWRLLFQLAEYKEYEVQVANEKICVAGCVQTLWIRYYLDFLVNKIGLILISAGLSLQLAASSDFMEFVLNAAAVTFVLDLDDLTSAKCFKICSRDALDPESSESHSLPEAGSASPRRLDDRPAPLSVDDASTPRPAAASVGSKRSAVTLQRTTSTLAKGQIASGHI